LVAIACAAFCIWRVIELREKGSGDSSDDDDWGGTRRGQDLISPKGSPGADPEWWPEFERQFAEHIQAQPHTQAAAPSAEPPG
jgi:hypothetical protein